MIRRACTPVLMFVLVAVGGCDRTRDGAPPPAASAADSPGSVNRSSRREPTTSLARTYRPGLGANDVRVSLVVLPGDALVEVDDLPVRRRNGLVELVGHVGDVRHVRAVVGNRSTEEVIVHIGAEGASPAAIDADAMKWVNAAPKKKTPVVFENE